MVRVFPHLVPLPVRVLYPRRGEARRVGVGAASSRCAMQAVLAALSLSLAPGVRVAAPLGGRLRPVSMTASLEAPTTAPKSFDELDAQAADRMPQRTRTLDTLGRRLLSDARASPWTEFVLQRTEEVAERGISITMYTHEATGAQVMLVDAPDANKVFSANFRTLPKDSTGVPHILEHSVLCGSKRYPSKEPFVDLLKGSLKTFLNAMTGADRTMYPVASQNKQDFFNLVNVYLDACLNPRILEPEHGARILEQEGLGSRS